ncbi:MAG: GNAT family N-acetyltransferase [Chloroflexi bacterium]|nr:GNAT family N-acetyltransferase [Chloroflexota bacterium]
MEDTSFELRTGSDIPVQQLITLYDSVGWKAYTTSRRRPDLPKALQNSSFVVSAWSGDTLVGLARGLSDDVSVVYLQDVLVLPGYQCQGIGTRLVQACLERYRHVRMCVLLADDEERSARFYESLGFQNIRNIDETPLQSYIRVSGVKL